MEKSTVHGPQSTEKNFGLQRLSATMHISDTGGVYETTKGEVEPDTKNTNVVSGKPYARWGADNDYPQRLINAVKSDPIAALIQKKIAFHYGRGLMFYKKEVDDKGNEKIIMVPDSEVPQNVKDFMDLNEWPTLQESIITDFEWWEMYHVQYILRGNGEVAEVKWQRTKDVRPELRDPATGKIKNYYLSGYWPNPPQNYYITVPAFERLGNVSGIYKHGSVSVDKDYFNDPAWHGITRWLYIASKIPRWILANIDNSMNLKYHVEIPFKYFEDRCPMESYPTKPDREKAIQDLINTTFQNMDKYLAGEANVHKAFYSFITLMEDGKPAPGWKITVLDNKVQDEAWLRAYGTAAIAMISGIGLSPSIAGSILPNGLGQGSGSDLREQFNFYIQVMTTRPREKTLEPWYICKKRNKWPEWLHLGYRDIVLQSTDENKSGFKQQNEQAPTNDSQTAKAFSV